MDSAIALKPAFFYPQPRFQDLAGSLDSFLFSSCVAVASAALLLLHVSISRLTRPQDDSDASTSHVSTLGGPVIFGCYLVRLVACFALTGIAIVQLLKEEVEQWIRVALLCIFLYSTLLSLISVSANWRWSQNSVRHLNTVLCATLAVYVYRDFYPLATFSLTPLDTHEGSLLWVKISLLALAGIVIPLVVPRKYVPVDPTNPKIPNPEQTSSLLSWLMYSFMDSVILKAYRSPNLVYEEIPPLSDSDYADYLKKQSFRYLDPTIVVKRRNAFYSLLLIFRKDYAIISVLLTLQSLLDFATPIGIKNLLGYLENNGNGAFFKPWVWIVWLFVSPTLQTMALESYIFISRRQAVQGEAILTEIILEHALRMRVKAETSEKESSDVSSSPPGSATPALDDTTISEVGENSTEDDQQPSHSKLSSDAHSVDTTLHTGSSTTVASSANLKKDASTKPLAPVLLTSTEPSTVTNKPKIDTKNILGKVNNLITTDLQNITEGKEALRMVIQVPILVTLGTIFLYNILGWSAFVGLAMTVLLTPIPGLLAKSMQSLQQTKMKKTDARIQTVTETMNVLRMVKAFGWQAMMNDRIKNTREEEITYIGKIRLFDLGLQIVNRVIPSLTMLATYATYTAVMKQELSASKVFSSMIVFERFGMWMGWSTWFIVESIKAKVSLDRITDFLYETELVDTFTQHTSDSFLPVSTEEIGFRDATFSWSNDCSQVSLTPSRRQFLLKIDGELIFMKGSINLIIGSTGSGKTSMLMALLSEMHFIPSGPDSWYNLPRNHGVAYAAQECWVQNATIKENIVFGLEFDEERYKKVLYQCALERDLELFQAGDETEVGEKGLTLSGGQKARVTLARAIYSKADIILLDDVLAALDVHTAKWIVEKCLQGDLIKHRTILMVTHNIALAQSVAGFVVAINDGRIISQGTVSDALSNDKVLTAQVQAEVSVIEAAKEKIDEDGDKSKNPVDGKLIVAEEVQVGSVGWPGFRLFLKGLGGRHSVLFFVSVLACIIISKMSEIVETWYLGYWASQYEIHEDDPSQINVIHYLTGYSLIVALFIVMSFCGYVVFLFGMMRSSRSIHKQLVQSVLGTTWRWLDTTPTSRVITRCTQDIRSVDEFLPGMFEYLVELTVQMAGRFFSVLYFSPAFLLPGLLITLAGALCGSVYIKAQLPIKRMQSNSRAPVLAHFGTVISGLVSVRAYGVQQRFIEESLTLINHYSRPARVFSNLNRWIDVRLDILGNIFATSLAVYLVYVGHGTASDTGFSLSIAVFFSRFILYYIRHINEFAVGANSLERINAYIEIEQEPKPTKEGVPPAYWPSSGDLRVENLSARYSPNGQEVLHDINFHVKSGERIGVVGRTGSGKSSLMLSLLRCIYTNGEVYFDGIPTSSLNLDDLRTKITIIPQMPELLSGNVRRNLDPFDQHDDATLHDALRSAGLYSIQSEDEDSRIGLDTAVASGGGNLSVGQRQILALARAMVRESKLLILDEATSAVDYKTDIVIQSSLRHELKSDVTLITVAHRLQTIMDADKIMVLDAGRIVEFDSSKELLKNDAGHLRALVEESADKEHLFRMAEGVGGSIP
ncbi:P-loop containing nucleoside triphosphate hydrolase protein [Gymnopus androsaceus JB14]|uniref:P-loop containing nucleoside triphosphate hydrolase protein n=1 Tax=Gymnopus androsaceus JB14 TaxID=1447944 RepID=A0A6A4HTL9_9AGAR|nr:P-loop containing nucleoside triphosphate hydrolase protein [Gymnopus androsaceus JB14]